MAINIPFLGHTRKVEPLPLDVDEDENYIYIKTGNHVFYHPATAPWLSFEGVVMDTDKAEQLAFISYVSTGSSGRYLVMTGWVTPNELTRVAVQ